MLDASQFILCAVMISYMQKLNRRRTALQKTKAITEEVKAKWKPCMVLELISSEESEWKIMTEQLIKCFIPTHFLVSDRAKPEGLGLPNWVFKQESV